MEWYLSKFLHLKDPRYGFYSMILFVTGMCNSECKGCLYGDRLNRGDDMEEIALERLTNELGNVWHLQISGGEPFLRHDLLKICRFFINKCATKLITIPTNGSFPKKAYTTAQELLNHGIRVGITVSVDGTEKVNDVLRRKGSYRQAMKCIKELQKIKSPKFYLSTSTRLLDANLGDIPNLSIELDKLGIKYKSFFPIRGKLPAGIDRPGTESYTTLVEIIARRGIANHLKTAIIQKSLSGDRWPFPCIAGQKMGVIDSNGDIRLCELLEPIGNLKEGFQKAWTSQAAEDQRKMIRSGTCSAGCTHGCFLWPSLMDKPEVIASLITKRFFL